MVGPPCLAFRFDFGEGFRRRPRQTQDDGPSQAARPLWSGHGTHDNLGRIRPPLRRGSGERRRKRSHGPIPEHSRYRRPHARRADQPPRSGGRQPLRQDRGFQSAGLGQGPAGARRDRGGRAIRRTEARPDGDRGDERQHRHRPRHGLRRQGLSAGGDDGGDLQRRAPETDAVSRRQGRAHAGGRCGRSAWSRRRSSWRKRTAGS